MVDVVPYCSLENHTFNDADHYQLRYICASTLSSVHWYWLEELWLVATKDFPTIATKYFRIIRLCDKLRI